MIYAGTILFFVGTTALILLAWVRLCGTREAAMAAFAKSWRRE
jgi:uncharacterized membrane protein YdcZ (DUF606 family)